MKYKCLKNDKYILDDHCLVALREADIYRIINWRNEQLDVLRQKKTISYEEQKKYYSEFIAPTFDEDCPTMMLFSYLINNKCIGYGGLTNIDWHIKRAEISFILATEYIKDDQKYEYDFSIFLHLIKLVAFSELGLNRLYTETYDIRPLHISILEKNGFRLEGRLRQHTLIEGKYQDSLIHGLLKSDD